MENILNKFQVQDQEALKYMVQEQRTEVQLRTDQTQSEIARILQITPIEFDYKAQAYSLFGIINKYFHNNELDLEQYIEHYPSKNIKIIPNSYSLEIYYRELYQKIHDGNLSFWELRSSIIQLCQISEKLDKINA